VLVVKKPLSGKYLNGPGGKYHAECFKCSACQKQLQGFVEKNGKAFRPSCSSKPQATVVGSTAGTTQKVGGFTIDARTGQKKFK